MIPIEDQIAWARSEWLVTNLEHKKAILASLEELKRIHEAEMPVEPEIVNIWRRMPIKGMESMAVSYIDALQTVIQRKDAEARKQREATEHWAICHNKQMERAESLELDKAALQESLAKWQSLAEELHKLFPIDNAMDEGGVVKALLQGLTYPTPPTSTQWAEIRALAKTHLAEIDAAMTNERKE